MREYTIWKPRFYRKLRTWPGYELVIMRYKKWLAVRRRSEIMANTMTELINDKLPLKRIEIETINRCTGVTGLDKHGKWGVCSFCPVSVKNDIRPLYTMSDELFEKLIAELEAINYSEGLYFSSNNEGLLDPKLLQRLEYARKHLPNAYFVIYTNGVLLTPKLYHALMKYLNCLMIDNYADNMKLLPQIKKTLEDATEDELSRTAVQMRYLHDTMDTRGGFSPTRHRSRVLKIGCSNLFSEMVISPNGDISLCCQDIYCKTVMGNLNENTLLEIWNGPKFKEVREKFLAEGRDCLPICSACDFIRHCPDCTTDIDSLGAKKYVSLEEFA